jgi:hypothetical protein
VSASEGESVCVGGVVHSVGGVVHVFDMTVRDKVYADRVWIVKIVWRDEW